MLKVTEQAFNSGERRAQDFDYVFSMQCHTLASRNSGLKNPSKILKNAKISRHALV